MDIERYLSLNQNHLGLFAFNFIMTEQENLAVVNINPTLEESWKAVMKDEFAKPYFIELKKFLLKEKADRQIIYPAGSKIFNALNLTPFNNVKVVILGQDPYHGEGQAQGLCFSVPDKVKHPPSLQNIFKEIHSDLGNEIPESGNLERWAKQGVLLLNSLLTVRANQPASHHKKGWEQFTDKVIETISKEKTGVVFLLWGRFAQDKSSLIDSSKHFILKAAHPSPLSSWAGFFGCKHFSKTNELLKQHGKKEIVW